MSRRRGRTPWVKLRKKLLRSETSGMSANVLMILREKARTRLLGTNNEQIATEAEAVIQAAEQELANRGALPRAA